MNNTTHIRLARPDAPTTPRRPLLPEWRLRLSVCLRVLMVAPPALWAFVCLMLPLFNGVGPAFDHDLYSWQLINIIGGMLLTGLGAVCSIFIPHPFYADEPWLVNIVLIGLANWLQRTAPATNTEWLEKYEARCVLGLEDWNEYVAHQSPDYRALWTIRQVLPEIVLLVMHHVEARMWLSIPLAACFGLILGVLLAHA